MIIVSVLRQVDDSIVGFKVSGHANYADHGKDIVCAGVSAITVGTVNSIEELAGVAMECQMKSGFLNAKLPADVKTEASDQVQLLLSSMVVMLKSIEDSYGTYIQIQNVII
ncbi:ribosomal-processing cysteine protease Prp [Paenibacillus aceti]|uniref:Ribosomal processing cysteine protease Prp n=1 Tax=Paenibacillus aceti TaxID=1820010 RepID=A0ABQ1VR61_9BACL|nr:ribosomal-processing cysteine protease Prp [Paenibacillus aceti]GGF88498.1 hypothetical protein GCM10010913_07410 [Paenibacillus aceti]